MQPSERAPHIAASVIYVLTEQDAEAIQATVTPCNSHKEGDHLPAIIVRVWPDSELAQLQVFPDGRGTFWATSRANGDGPGTWHWAQDTPTAGEPKRRTAPVAPPTPPLKP